MKKILLVEDNPDNADLVFAFLDDLYDIQACSDGFEALELLQQETFIPDLCLCDISLPRMDGIQLLQEIRKLNQYTTLPVIALTSHAMKGDQERFLAAGFNAYVSKPLLSDDVLIKPIEQLLR